MSEPWEEVFEGSEDPRAPNARRHDLHDIPIIAFCTMLCVGQTCTDMEHFGHAKRELLQTFLKLGNGIPSHDNFSRTTSPGPWECRTRWASSSGSWVSCRGLPRAVRESLPWTGRPCAGPTTGRRGAPPCTWSAPGRRSGLPPVWPCPIFCTSIVPVLRVNQLFPPVRRTPWGTGFPERGGAFPHCSVFASFPPFPRRLPGTGTSSRSSIPAGACRCMTR